MTIADQPQAAEGQKNGRKCLNCGKPIPASKRADSKFDTNGCRYQYWIKKNK